MTKSKKDTEVLALSVAGTPKLKVFDKLREKRTYRFGYAGTGFEFVFICEPDYKKSIDLMKGLDPDLSVSSHDDIGGFCDIRVENTIPGLIANADKTGRLVTTTIVWNSFSYIEATLEAFEREDSEIIRNIRHEIGHAVERLPLKIPLAHNITEYYRMEFPGYVSELLNSFVDCELLGIVRRVESGFHLCFPEARILGDVLIPATNRNPRD